MAVAQAAPDQVFLRAVEGVPQGAVGVGFAAGADNLAPVNLGQRLIVVAEAQGGLTEDALFVPRHFHTLKLLSAAKGQHSVIQHAVGAFDHLVQHAPASVTNLDLTKAGVGNRHAVEADEAEQASMKLVAAGAVVGVHQDHFRVAVANLRRAGQIVLTAEADQVLGEGALLAVARAADLHLDRQEALLGEARQQLMGGDHLKTLRAAGVGSLSEHGRGELADLLVGQGLAARGLHGDGTATKATGEGGERVHGSLLWLGLKHRASVREACISQVVMNVNPLHAQNVKIVESVPAPPVLW